MAWKLEVAADRPATTWTDRTSIVDRKTLAIGGIAHRAEIDAGSGFDLADDAGSITLPARRVVRVIEDATTPDTQLFRGRLIRKGMARGTLPIGNAKQFDVAMVDHNADFGGLPLSRWRRPAETDHARVRALLEQFLQGTKRPSTNLTDTYLQTGSPVNLPAYTYDAPVGGPAGVLAHILGEAEFKDCFITEDSELFYGPRSSTVYAAGLAITDDNPDGVTSFPPIEPAGDEDGSEWLGGVKVVYRNRRFVYVIDNAAINAHDSWYTTVVDETIPNLAAATRRGQVLLRDVKNENTSYRCQILLRNTQVNLIKRGQTVSFRSAAAGLLTPMVFRVGHLVWHPAGSEHWIADLELDFPRKMAGTIPPRVEGQPGPFVPGTDLEPGDDIVSIYEGITRSGGAPGVAISDSFDVIAGHPWRRVIHFAVNTGGRITIDCAVGGTLVNDGIAPGTLDLDLSDTGLLTTATGCVVNMTPDAGQTMTTHATDAGKIMYTDGSGLGGTQIPATPIAGQQVTEATTGDGATTSFATNYPYMPRSLQVYVGGVHVVPTESDPDAGTFTLPFAPDTGAQILIRYIAADGADLGTGNDDAPDSVPPSLPTVIQLDDLSDVTITSLATADRLRYDGSTWRNSAYLWKPVMDGLGNVVTDSGTGEAIMTEVLP